jgi:hypothetical protein
MTVDEIIEAAQRGEDPSTIRAHAAAITLSLSDVERRRLEAMLETLPRRGGLLTLGGG